jgi:hypothetical protein
MAKKLKSPLTPAEWMTEIDNGLEYRRIFGREESWPELERMYLNDPSSACAIGPNLIFSMGDSLLSALCVPDPEFIVTPKNPQSQQQAPIVESLSNTFVKTLNLKEQVEMACLHAYLYGVGILKIGYDSEFGWDDNYDIGGPLQPAGMTFTQFNPKTGARLEDGTAKPGQPWVKAVSPHDIVVPWGTKDLETAPWIAHRIIRRTHDIKKDPKYKNTSRLEPQVSMEQFIESYDKTSQKRHISFNLSQYNSNKKEMYNELWEIHDQTNGRMYTISTDFDQFLRDDVDAIQTIGSPFVGGGFIRHPRAFWGTPQAFYLGQIQATQSDIALQAEKQRRISQVKFLINDDAISEDELNKLMSADVGGIGRVKGTGIDLRNVIVPAPQGSSLDLIYHADVNRRYARDAVGLSSNQLGEFDTSSRRTATESQIVESGSQNRQAHRIDVLNIFYLQTMRKCVGLASRFWFMPQATKVNDDWVFFTGDMLKGQYDYDMHLSNKRHLSSFDRSFEALQLLGQLAQYPGANLAGIESYVTEIARDPRFATFFLSSQQGKGLSASPSGVNGAQQAQIPGPRQQGGA